MLDLRKSRVIAVDEIWIHFNAHNSSNNRYNRSPRSKKFRVYSAGKIKFLRLPISTHD